MSSRRYNPYDRPPSGIDEMTPRKRTSSEVDEANDSMSTSDESPIDCTDRTISTGSINQRLQSEPDKPKQTDQNLVDLRAKFLTPEILLQVIEFLPPTDRKNVRLTCEQWNEQCESASITAHEKIVFRATACIADVNTLLTYSFVVMNLEFHTPLVNSLSADMWAKFGHRVREINFFSECSLRYETLENMILNCANLTTLKLWYDWDPDLSSRMLDSLIDKGVKRSQLRTFATFHQSYSRVIPSPDIMEKILVIFPCVKRFCVRNYNPFVNCYLEGTPLLLKLPTHLESLQYNVKTHDSWLENPTVPAWQSRLTRFEARLEKPKDAARIFQFFAIQKELESVALCLTNCEDLEFTKKLMFHVLEQCSKLREFRMSSRDKRLILTAEECNKFFVLISKLRVLTINFFFLVDSAPTLSPINFALTAVSLAGDLHYASSFNIFTYCSRVQHLELTYEVDDTLLQRIFENMLDLKTLILYCRVTCTTFGFTGQDSTRDGGYSIKRLQQLEHLEIMHNNLPYGYDIMEISREFHFPRLKDLKFDVNSLDVDVCQITLNTPALESLILNLPSQDEGGYTLQQTIEFCKSLKKLKYLYMPIAFEDCNLRNNTTTMGPLFEACPSLRYVRIFHQCDMFSFVFSFDPFSKEVQLHYLTRPFRFPGWERFTMFKKERDFFNIR